MKTRFRVVGIIALLAVLPLIATISAQEKPAATPAAPASAASAADDAMFQPYLKNPAFAAAWNAYREGRYEAAYDLFSDLLQDQPDDAVNFALALAARRAGKPSHAAMAYERILTRHPDNIRARLELGRLYFEIKQYGLAEEQFEKALAAKPPAEVRENVRKYLERINASTRRWQVDGAFQAGALYDNNVNAGPNASSIGIAPMYFGATRLDTLDVGPESQPKEAGGLMAALALSVTHDLGEKEKWSAVAGGSYYQNWLNEEHDYELLAYNAMAALQYTDPQRMFQLPVRTDHLTRGHDDLLNTYGIGPAYVLAPSRDWMWLANSYVEYRDYMALDDRDATCLGAGPGLKFLWGPKRNSLSLGFQGFSENARADTYSDSGWSGEAGAEARPVRGMTLYARGQFKQAWYEEKEALATETRRDDQLVLSGGARKLFGGRWMADLNYQHTHNDSTFDLYTYDRDAITLTLMRSF